MFEKITEFFTKDRSIKEPDELTSEVLFKDDIIEPKGDCANCLLKDRCQSRGEYREECADSIELKDFDEDKDTFLIIDDHAGVISFLMDDMDYFCDEGFIDRDKVNILPITSVNAAFTLKLLYEKLPRLNIKWAIIDITLGGSKMLPEGNIKYTGVDVFEMIHKVTPDVSFVFYTGNNLNPYIKSNEKLIEQFKDITGNNIKDYVLFKTSMDINKRRKFIIEQVMKDK